MEDRSSNVSVADQASGPVPHLSVVIRSRNEEKGLRQVFEALQAQRCTFPWEVVVVDNESEDGTRALCNEFNVRVVRIGRNEFTYGRASNLGISNARGTLVLLLSAHSLPVGSYFLESAVSPFCDPAIAAVRCLRSDAEHIKNWYRPIDIQYQSEDDQKRAESGLDWTRNYPAANGCVIRRSVWEQVKYDEEIESGEDKLWASKVLSLGFKIRCCAEAIYIYTRKRRKIDEWKRHNMDYKALYRFSGYVPLPWSQFLLRTLRAILVAPLVAGRHVLETLIWNFCLVTIPWQAKRNHRAGSLREFDRHN